MPTAGGDAFLNQQSLGAQTPAFSLPAVEENFIYLRRDDGTIYRVPVMNDNQVLDMSPRTRQVGFEKPPPSHGSRTKCLIAEEDPLVSSDDDCPVVPKPGWRHIWRQAANGEKYFTEELIPASSEKKYEWVKDEVTGRTSKRLVEVEANPEFELRTVIDPSTGREAHMLVPRTPTRLGAAKPLRKQTASKTPTRVDHRAHLDHLAAAPRYERAPSYIAPTEDKQGKDNKSPVLVQYARNCPVAWTSKVTSDKLNMGLWCWAYVSELLATRTGAAPPLANGELEARLQHFLNVLEISLQPSNPTEFDGPSWKVARLYAEKIQQKVDKGGSWLAFEQRYGADSHPHELMAAQVELAPKVKPKEPKEVKKADKVKDSKEKRTCTTWNTSEVENKCKFEVDYEGRECINKHECSWCKEKHRRSLPHQRAFCRQRINAREQ